MKCVSKKFLETAEMYKYFCKNYSEMDLSDEAMLAAYNKETYGVPKMQDLPLNNGFRYGKQFLDVTLAMWSEDILIGNLRPLELIDGLYEEPIPLLAYKILCNKIGLNYEDHINFLGTWKQLANGTFYDKSTIVDGWMPSNE